MKKFLSLVLALVMTMSLVTISAGAEDFKDFTDDSKITYKEAVDVISALEVVDGYADGTFNPTATLTRGAAAKIICNLILGPTTASALSADAAPYSDVPANSTFAGYIAFCSKEGIISGYADGTFRPGNSLTGYAFMKMLLGALGYDQEVESYVGNNWSINVAKRALNIELDDDLVGDFNGTKPVTREEAALYAFNTLQTTMVEYDSKTTVTAGDTTVVVSGSKAQDMRNSTSTDGNIKDDDLMQFAEKYFTKLKLEDSESEDVFGRPASTWYKKNDKIGTYADSADLTYTKNVKAKDIYKDLDLSKDYSYTVIVDGDTKGTLALNKNNDTKVAAVGGVVGDGSNVEIFKDEHKIVVINEYIMQVAGEYNTKEGELTLQDPTSNVQYLPGTVNFTLDDEDFTGLDGFKDEEYVVVTLALDGGTYEVQDIASAEKVTAAVTEYVDDDTVTAGGKEYKYNVVAKQASGISDFQYTLKDEYDFYLDSNGNVLYAEGVEADGSYVYIAEFYTDGGSTKADKKAYAYFLDGTDKSVTLNKIDGTKVSSLTATGTGYTSKLGTKATGWYRFSEKSDGKYDLTSVSNVYGDNSGSTVDVTDYDNQKTTIGLGTSSLKGNAATKFVVIKANDDVVTYTGIKSVADITTGAGSDVVITAVKDGSTNYAKYVFIDVGTNGVVKGGNTSSDLIYIMKVDATYGHDSDDDTYYRFKAIVNGEEVKVKGDTGMAVGMLYTDIEYTSKNYVTSYTAVASVSDSNYSVSAAVDTDDFLVDSTVAVSGGASVKKNTLTVEGNGYYLADGAKVYVNKNGTDDLDTYTAGQFVANYKDVVGKTLNIFNVLNADGETTALYVNYR